MISPHGRGLNGRANSILWGNLPGRGSFAVINPDARGRRVAGHSWGYAGQIADLARMPEILRTTLPWLRIDRSRIYAFGGSMGGQETLLLLARHPSLLAGAAAFSSVTDLALQYRNFDRVRCKNACRVLWAAASAPTCADRAPRDRRRAGPAPGAYAARSPITYARAIAASCVPLQLWWSVSDQIVVDQQSQSGKLFWQLRRLNPSANVRGIRRLLDPLGRDAGPTGLPLALSRFGLLPQANAWQNIRHVRTPAEGACTRARPGFGRAPLLGRHVADLRREHPEVALGVVGVIAPVAVGHVDQLLADLRARRLRPLVVRIDVVDVDLDLGRQAAAVLRAPVVVARVAQHDRARPRSPSRRG